MAEGLNNILGKAETSKISSAASTKWVTTEMVIKESEELLIKPDSVGKRAIFTNE